MTGATVILKQGLDYVLFKMRHDGYFVQEYFKDKKQAFKQPLDKAIVEMMKSFEKQYNCTYPDEYSIETSYPYGFKTKLNDKFDLYDPSSFNSLEAKLEEQMIKDCTKKNKDPDEEGLFCGYGDYLVILDYDTKEVFGLISEVSDDLVVFDENFKVIHRYE